MKFSVFKSLAIVVSSNWVRLEAAGRGFHRCGICHHNRQRCLAKHPDGNAVLCVIASPAILSPPHIFLARRPGGGVTELRTHEQGLVGAH